MQEVRGATRYGVAESPAQVPEGLGFLSSHTGPSSCMQFGTRSPCLESGTLTYRKHFSPSRSGANAGGHVCWGLSVPACGGGEVGG